MRERDYSPADLAYFTSMTGRPRLSAESELRQPGAHEGMIGTPDYGMLIAAHAELVQDFRDRMTRSEFHLRGVQTRPTLTAEARNIAGVWAAECEFDFRGNCVTVASKRFVAVAASRELAADALDDSSRAAAFALPGSNVSAWAPTPTDVADLSDEIILALLKEHARRVIESPGPKMMARIKDVLQPLIVRRLERRAAQGLLAAMLAEEARQLQSWIGEVASWHPIPKSQTVENNIRDAYNALKARSHTTIP